MAEESVGLVDKPPYEFPNVCLGRLTTGNKVTSDLDVGAKQYWALWRSLFD